MARRKSKSENTTHLGIMVPPALKLALEQRSDASDLTVSEIVRRGIRLYFAQLNGQSRQDQPATKQGGTGERLKPAA